MLEWIEAIIFTDTPLRHAEFVHQIHFLIAVNNFFSKKHCTWKSIAESIPGSERNTSRKKSLLHMPKSKKLR